MAGGLPVLEVTERDTEIAASGIACADEHDLLRAGQRQIPDEDGIHDREHSVVRADPEREHHDGHQREPPILDEQSGGEADVVKEVHEGPALLRRAAHSGGSGQSSKFKTPRVVLTDNRSGARLVWPFNRSYIYICRPTPTSPTARSI